MDGWTLCERKSKVYGYSLEALPLLWKSIQRTRRNLLAWAQLLVWVNPLTNEAFLNANNNKNPNEMLFTANPQVLCQLLFIILQDDSNSLLSIWIVLTFTSTFSADLSISSQWGWFKRFCMRTIKRNKEKKKPQKTWGWGGKNVCCQTSLQAQIHINY